MWESVLADQIKGSKFDILGLVNVIEGPSGAVRLTEGDESREFRVTYEGAVVHEINSDSDRYPSACWATLEHLYCLMVEIDERSDGEISARYVIESVDAFGHLALCDDITSYQDPAGVLHFQRIDNSGGSVFMFVEDGSVVEGIIEFRCP